MPSRISLTNEEKQAILNQILEQAQNALNGNFEGSEKLSISLPKMEPVEITNKPKIIITHTAGLKMSTLVRNCTDEVGWHGFVERPDKNTFLITDIVVYPQTVTGATVTTDEMEYALWLNNLTTSEIKQMRFQGHSHVNMGVTPSSTDLTLYNNYLANLSNDDFYIFFICNKKGDINAILYDLETNTKYTKNDIEIIKETDMSDWYNTIKENIKTIRPVTQPGYHSQMHIGAGYYDDMEFEAMQRERFGNTMHFQDSWDQRVKNIKEKEKKKRTKKGAKK